jgi:hypothetical protein
VLNATEPAGVAQHGKSVRLIIERSRARVPPPAPIFSRLDILTINIINFVFAVSSVRSSTQKNIGRYTNLIGKIEHSITVTDGRIPEKPRTNQSSVEECKDSSSIMLGSNIIRNRYGFGHIFILVK